MRLESSALPLSLSSKSARNISMMEANSLTKSVIATRVAGDYRVKTTFAATAPTTATTANVHYAVRDGAADFTGVAARMGRRPRRPTLQLETGERRSPSSGKHRWTASES